MVDCDAEGCVSNSFSLEQCAPQPRRMVKIAMKRFPEEKVSDFKHVIYNELVENHNNGAQFVRPCRVVTEGGVKFGFQFNEKEDPDSKLPELYCGHIKKAKLQNEVQNPIFMRDLYKYYLRSCVELLGKYFEKVDKYTYMYDDEWPLFVSNEPLDEAQRRLRTMKTRARRATPYKRRRAKSMLSKPVTNFHA